MVELAFIFGFPVTVIWIVIGWRAMRAHERIAHELARCADNNSPGDLQNLRRQNAAQHKDYNQFIIQHPEVEKMPSKERHDRFREWLLSRV